MRAYGKSLSGTWCPSIRDLTYSPMYLWGTSAWEFWWATSGAVHLTAYPYLSISDTISGFQVIYPSWYINTYLSWTFGTLWQARHLLIHFGEGLLLPEDKYHNFPVRWPAIIRHACSPFIQRSLYIISLYCDLWIITPPIYAESLIYFQCIYYCITIYFWSSSHLEGEAYITNIKVSIWREKVNTIDFFTGSPHSLCVYMP